MTEAEFVAWCEKQPELMKSTYLPVNFRDLRRKHGCSAPRGGKREKRGDSFYVVRNGVAI